MARRSHSKTHNHENKHDQSAHRSQDHAAQDGNSPVSDSQEHAVSASVAGPLLTRLEEGKDTVVHELAELKSNVETELRQDLGQAKTWMRSASKGMGRLVDGAQRVGKSALGGVRDNPIPAVLIGAGLTWLLVDAVRTRGAAAATSTARGSVDAPRTRAVVDKIAGVAQSVQNSVSTAMDSVVQETGAVVQRVEQEARQMERLTEKTFQRNPLAVGASVLAAGAAIGFALPNTGAEDSLLGSARDSVMHAASDLVHGALTRVEGITNVVAGPSTAHG